MCVCVCAGGKAGAPASCMGRHEGGMGVGVAAAVVGAALRATGDGRHGTDAVPNYSEEALLRVARTRAHGVRRETKCMSGGRDLARRHGTSGSGDEWATADAGTERLRGVCAGVMALGCYLRAGAVVRR